MVLIVSKGSLGECAGGGAYRASRLRGRLVDVANDLWRCRRTTVKMRIDLSPMHPMLISPSSFPQGVVMSPTRHSSACDSIATGGHRPTPTLNSSARDRKLAWQMFRGQATRKLLRPMVADEAITITSPSDVDIPLQVFRKGAAPCLPHSLVSRNLATSISATLPPNHRHRSSHEQEPNGTLENE
jgi:hypothetical protein